MSVPETEQETAMPDESGTELPTTLNEEISEWCEPKPSDSGLSVLDNGTISPGGFWRLAAANGGFMRWLPRYNFSESRDACAGFERKLEAKTERLPDGRGYFEAYLVAIAEAAGTQLLSDAWNATPAQRCAAMLRVIRETQKGGFHERE